MLIYVAHPYGGKEENKKAVEEKIKKLVKKYPIHTFGYMYNWVKDYEQGMQMCLNLLKRCDRLILCEGWSASKGCNREYDFAKKSNIKALSYKEVLLNWKF